MNFLMRTPPFLGLVFLLLVGFLLCNCAGYSSQEPAELQLEEHRLAAAPEPETRSFTPEEGSQDNILAEHAGERSLIFNQDVSMVEGLPAINSLGEREDLYAILTTAQQGQPEQTVVLKDRDKTIFETEAGLPSPLLPLQGLWTFNGHWALEILIADEDTWAGKIFIDGELVNAKQGYEDAFGFQLLSGKPFFFFRRDNRLGYSFGGNEKELDYDEIIHYRCCSESSLNPVPAEHMVAFFAVRDQNWFYVELGDFTG